MTPCLFGIKFQRSINLDTVAIQKYMVTRYSVTPDARLQVIEIDLRKLLRQTACQQSIGNGRGRRQDHRQQYLAIRRRIYDLYCDLRRHGDYCPP